MVLTKRDEEVNPIEELRADVLAELEQTQRELEEIELLLSQSQVEISKLTQRNAAATARLQQLQGHFDTVPREDIRAAYEDVLDTQQRMFVMRGQAEKLQNDKKHLERYRDYLRRVAEVMQDENGMPLGTAKAAGAFKTVEAIIQAQEAERQRLSRQMHDGPAQALSNFILQTEIAVRLFDIDQEKAREELLNLKDAATSAFQKVRDFVFELRPMMLDDLGVVPTLKRYVEAFKEQNDASVRLSVTGVERRFESYIEVIIFRAIQELLSFAVHQSQATQITVHIDATETNVKVTVDDNGKGIDLDDMEGAGMGIKLIKERVEMLGGYFEIDSRPGKGAQITFQVPAGASVSAVFA